MHLSLKLRKVRGPEAVLFQFPIKLACRRAFITSYKVRKPWFNSACFGPVKDSEATQRSYCSSLFPETHAFVFLYGIIANLLYDLLKIPSIKNIKSPTPLVTS